MSRSLEMQGFRPHPRPTAWDPQVIQMYIKVWETLLWNSLKIVPWLVSSLANLLFQLHETIQTKSKVNLQMVILEELLLHFPPLSPRGHTFGGGNTKGEMWPVCHCGHLSELAVPKRGPDTLLCAPWVLNKYLLASLPAQMWEQCVFLSKLGEIYPPNRFIWFKARSHKSACLLVLESSGAGGTEGEGRVEQSEAKQEAAESTECITVLKAWNKQKQSMPITA